MKIEREKNMPKYCYRRKDSPFIWYRFKVNGEVYTGSTETADTKLAESIVGKYRTDAVSGKVMDKENDIDLLAMIKLVNIKRKASDDETRNSLNVANSPIMKGKKAREVLLKHVDAYHAWRVGQVSESSVNREISSFQACYSYAIKHLEYNLKNPAQGWARFDESSVARDRVLNYEERQRLINDPEYPQQMKDVFIWALQTGMRKGEIAEAKWAHINWADKTIRVKSEKKKKRRAKSNPFRFVPLNIYPMDILKRRRKEGWEQKSEFIFCTEDGRKLSADGQLTTAFEFACLRNKIQNMRFHDLRHTFATDFLRANHDLRAIKALSEMLGHSESRITEKYTHLWPEDKGNQIALLPPIPGYQIGLQSPDPSYAATTQAKETMAEITKLLKSVDLM